MALFLQAVIGAIVWALANLVYIDLKRKGKRGFGRLVSFWAGTPTTWLSFFVVPEGVAPEIEPPEDDEERLLREIRVDRELRGSRAPEAARPGDADARGALPG